MHLLQRFPAGVIPQRVKRGRASTTNQESFFTPKMGVIIRKSYFESFSYKESWLQFLKIYKELQYLRQREVQTMVSSTKMAQTVKFSDEEIAEFKKFFSLSDEDGDGRITTKELGTLMTYVGLDSAEAEFHDMISNIDFPIDFLELLDLMSRNMKVVFGSATISYKYVSLNGSSSNTRTTLGNLSGTDDNVYVDFGSLSDADNFLHRFSHKNYLPIVLVDYEASCILHLPYSLPLVDHVKSLKLSNIFPIMTYNFLDETNSYEYVCETYRELSKSLIDFLLHLHTINKSLVHFSLDNLCIRDGVLNIWGVRFSEMDEKSRQQDFALASSVIKAIFALGGKEPQQKYPYDFHQFLLEMSDKKRRKDEIIENHFALLNAKERCQFAKNLRDVQEGFNVSDFKRYMSAARGLKSNAGWIARLKTRAVKACLNYKKNKYYADKGSGDKVSSSLMRICRNTATHTWGELYRYLTLQAPHPDSIQYKDIECIIMKEFGRVLTDFHVLLKLSGVGHFFDSF